AGVVLSLFFFKQKTAYEMSREPVDESQRQLLRVRTRSPRERRNAERQDGHPQVAHTHQKIGEGWRKDPARDRTRHVGQHDRQPPGAHANPRGARCLFILTSPERAERSAGQPGRNQEQEVKWTKEQADEQHQRERCWKVGEWLERG